jgi:tetratricopeptide (TPR) repeat protein
MSRSIAAGLRAAALVAAASLALGAQTGRSPFDEAMKLFNQKNWTEAAAAFGSVESAQPGQTEALLLQGKCLTNLGRFAEADAILERYLAGHPQSEDAAYLLAYNRFREDKPKESLELFTAAARLKSPSSDDLKIVALDYVLLNDYADAARYLEDALRMVPANTEVLYHLGRVRYQQNRFDAAVATFESVLRQDPANIRAQNNLGLSLEAKNQIDAAITAYRKAITLDQASSSRTEQPYLNLGALLTKLNRSSEAVAPLRQAVLIAPGSGKAHYELGAAYVSLEQPEDARSELETGVKLEPRSIESHYLLARVYQRLGKSDLAAKEFKITEQLVHARDASSGATSQSPLPNVR